MIHIVFHKRAGVIVFFEITGHANAGKYGQDIVCASISSVSIMTLNGILEVLHLPVFYDIRDGYLMCDMTKIQLTEKQKELVHVLTQSLYLCLKELSQEYPKNIRLIMEEV